MTPLVRRASRSGRQFAEALWLPTLLVIGWWLLSADSTSIYFPSLEGIWDSFIFGVTQGSIIEDLSFSIANLIAGLSIGILAGISVGITIGELPRLRQVIDPFLQFARSVPQVALVPILIGALGIGQAPKIYLIAFASVWPVLLNAVDGVRGISPEIRDLIRAYRVPRVLAIWKVVLPAALPQIVAGIRISLAIAVVVMVVSEFFSSHAGIGHFVYMAGNVYDMPSAWAGTIIVALLGYLLSLAFAISEKRALRWYFESTGQSRKQDSPRTSRRA